MLDFLYNIFIGPIQYLIEVVFATVFDLVDSKILSIVGVSLVVNFLVLPLYKRSDAVQEKERAKQKAMEPMVKHIRKTFKGDKRSMILQEYYRQNDYSAVQALKGSFSLLLQIPFFLAAYNFLSTEGLLNGTSFFIFRDLGEPDRLFNIGTFAINVLPILMTLINVVSGAVYTKGSLLREKVQVYLTAAVFLVLLYNSPSGLVIYWILNNLFSLVKNIVMAAVKHARKNRPVKAKECKKQKPLTFEAFNHKFVLDRKPDMKVMVLSCLYLAVLMGVYVPSVIVSASPLEFLYTSYDWTDIILNTFSTYLGFAFWALLIYCLVSDRAKYVFTFTAFACCGIFTCDYLLFSDYAGNISEELIYEEYPLLRGSLIIGSLILAISVGLIFNFLYRWKSTIARYATLLFLITAVINSVILCAKNISSSGVSFVGNRDNSYTIDEAIIPLSKEGQNVIVFMMDRAVGSQFSKMIEEDPQIAEELSGFTFYPNTISYGAFTNFATPSLFGGYDYTPYKINKRSDELLKDKQNEALLVMPRIFGDNGYKVTVCDPPYAGDYNWIPNLEIYDEYPNVTAYDTIGHVVNETHRTYSPYFQMQQYHNYIGYGFFRCLPNIFAGFIYDNGNYHGVWKNTVSCSFLDSYCVLEELPKLTYIEDSDENTLLVFQNATPHEPESLLAPDYVPSFDAPSEVSEYEKAYCSGMASLLKICDWIDYLKENGVYDNTRIIIVSDHGRWYEGEDFMIADFNPLLLVKDFNSAGELSIDNSFMTNADTPYLAMEGLFDEPTNPYTGNLISMTPKFDEKIAIIGADDTNVNKLGDKCVFNSKDSYWFTVHDNIFDYNNWAKIPDDRMDVYMTSD